ncbi:MAG: PAQR family membrane homeostasis protein TrhA [Candidatus Krumholzibacteriia bacterium]
MEQRRRGHYSLGEEIANSVSHGLGAGLSVLGLVLLVIRAVRAGDPWQIVSFAIFGATMVVLYTSSTLYHAMRPPRARRVFKILDHGAIYLLIAGTYTPFVLVSLRGPWGWSMFGIIWGLAIGGIVFKIWFAGRFKLVSTLIYLGMGWLCAVAARPLIHHVPGPGLLWMLAGGLFYSGGTAFYLQRSMKYHHAIWHLFVLAGTACHFWAIYHYVGRLAPA